MFAADHLSTEEPMALGSFIVLHTVFLMAAAQKDCNHQPKAESNVSSGAPNGRVECSRPYPESSCLRVGSESDPECLESASEADTIEDAQQPVQEQQEANISGTVTDENGEVIPGAGVVLVNDGVTRNATSDDTGFFEFRNVRPGDSYRVIVTATEFATWKSEILHVDAAQFLIVDKIKLKVVGGAVSVTVTASPQEIATEQVRIAEH